IRSTNNNTWGLGISEEGIIFGSTANHNPSVYMPIANRYYERVKGWAPSLVLGTIAESHLFKPVTDKVRQVDQHGGYTAGAGHALYTARNYPKEYWNRVAFVNGPTGHLVGTFVLRPDGADFTSKYSFNLLASDDEWTAPIMSEIGPDGNVWVIDWYNYIVQHNPTPRGFENGPGNAYMTDLRDKRHGRIYRLVYDEAPKPSPQSLQDATSEQLVATLKSDVMLWRKHAQRLLVERGDKSVIPALVALASNADVDEIGLNAAATHALWTLKGLGALDGNNAEATQVARNALKHSSAGVRRNAIQVQPSEPASVDAIVENGLLQDPHPQVRLAAMLALADLPTGNSETGGKQVAAVADDATSDKWMSDALVAAAANNSHGFLKSIAANSKALSDPLAERVKIVAEHYGRSAPIASVGDLIASFADANPETIQTIVSGMADGWPADKKPAMTASLEQNLETLVNRLDTGGRGQLLRLASVWGSEKLAKYSNAIVEELLAKVDDEDRSVTDRLTAARELVQFQSGSDATVETILERITLQTQPELAEGLVAAIGQSEAPKFGELLISHLNSATPRVRSQGLQILLGRRGAIPQLLDAIDAGDVQLAEFSLDQRQNLARHPDRQVRRRAQEILERGGALPNANRQKVIEEYLPITKVTGDPVAGKLAFKKICAKCHMHSGEGASIGPDLTGMAVHPKEELLTHILDPNQSVESNFRLYTAVTVDGKVINGMLASESRTALEFFDAEGKKTTVLRDDIEEFTGTRTSLMPEGVEKELSRQELTDLLEFLTKRGSFVPLDFAEGATIASDQGLFTGGERYVIPGWETQTFKGVPFDIADPQNGKVKNIILLNGPLGDVCRKMPKRTSVKVGVPARGIHLLSGASGWGYPYNSRQSTSMSVEVHYEDGTQEVTEFKNGVHFADYIRRVDVPESEFAFMVGPHQIRYLAIYPTKSIPVTRIDFVKGDDRTAPIVLAATVETQTDPKAAH
ncbi:MAG: c-type cytochrome, partial [Planctomycetales bacterium]|nr:c-type cytochrome [Planctomycetales bacterium]